jgi:hypothetical protein
MPFFPHFLRELLVNLSRSLVMQKRWRLIDEYSTGRTLNEAGELEFPKHTAER